MGMVSQFLYDYMHLVCLGVMRRLLNIWVHGPSAVDLKKADETEVSNRLLKVGPSVLHEFSRKMRSLTNLPHWKATEYRLFVLYVGPYVMEGVLSSKCWNHFMLLHVAISILVDPFLSSTWSSAAEVFLRRFIKNFSNCYPSYPIVYNIHSLAHLVNDVERYGQLDNFFCFSYESYLGSIKKLVRGTQKPLKQVANHLHEQDVVEKRNDKDKMSKSVHFLAEHQNGPLPDYLRHLPGVQYEKVQCGSLRYSIFSPDSCIQFGTSIGLIQNIFKKDSNFVLVVKKFNVLKDAFSSPCQSSKIYVYEVNAIEDDIEVIAKSAIIRKYILINISSKQIVVPLHHDLLNHD